MAVPTPEAAGLSLDTDQVRRAVRFLDRFGRTMLDRVQGPSDEAADAGLAAEPPDAGDERATSLHAAASAFREAGQWLLYLDPREATAYLDLAGRLYTGLGEPFGIFLRVVAGSWGPEPPSGPFLGPVGALAEHLGPDARELPRGLRYPHQQAYLMLAACGSPAVRDELVGALAHILDASANAGGVLAVGALGTPLRAVWAGARGLALGEGTGLAEVTGVLGSMCLRYREAMELGRVNTYLWRNAAAPVDVGDIDIAGLACLAARRFGGEAVLGELGYGPVGPLLDPVALGPVTAGVALAGPDPTDGWSGW